MKVTCLQIDSVWEDKAANHKKALSLIDRAKPQPRSLVVLPEMFASGFSMNVEAIHDSRSHETQDFLSQLAADYHVYLMAGVVTKDPGGRGRNECVVYDTEGREMSRYCKLQPFSPGTESEHYVAGDRTCVFKCEEFTIASFICYDLRFPEIFRAAVKRGANLYTVIASWPIAREEHWVSLLKARAIENQAYVVGVNRTGRDPKFEHPGRSLIVDYHGKVIADAGREEGFISADLNLEELLNYRRDLPFLKDIRPDYLRFDHVRDDGN